MTWLGALEPSILLSGSVLLITVLSILVAAARLDRQPRRLEPKEAVAGVSIVRPLCGLERFSEETLAAGFRLDHPLYEVILCVATRSDPIVPLAERVMADNPQVPSRLLVGDDPVSDNPKLNNCVKGWEAARHDWVILADSNVLMPPDYVRTMLGSWRSQTGLVCSTPAGSRPEGFWAEVECAFLNSMQARWQYAGEALGLGFAQGKSMLWWKPFLDSRGGIRALAADAAEDAAATKLVRAAGRSVHLVPRPFEQPLGKRRASEVWGRQVRWARLRRVTFLPFFLPEIFSGPVAPALLLAVWPPGPGVLGLGLIAGLFAVWYGLELWLARRVGWFVSWRSPLAFLVRDLLIPPLWLAAFATRNVVWRGNSMCIRTGARPGWVGS